MAAGSAVPPRGPSSSSSSSSHRDQVVVDGVVVEEATGVSATYTSFTARQRPQHWGLDETRTFYGALRQCGTDFTLMTGFFPAASGRRGRTRRQLKSKFLAESRKNPKLVNLALRNRTALDVAVFDAPVRDAVSAALTAPEPLPAPLRRHWRPFCTT